MWHVVTPSLLQSDKVSSYLSTSSSFVRNISLTHGDKFELTQCVANFFPNQSTHISCTCKRNFSNLCRLNVISASNNKSFDQKWVLFQSLSPQFNRNLIFTENTKCTQHVGICFGCKNLETLLKITLNHEIPNRKPRIN